MDNNYKEKRNNLGILNFTKMKCFRCYSIHTNQYCSSISKQVYLGTSI